MAAPAAARRGKIPQKPFIESTAIIEQTHFDDFAAVDDISPENLRGELFTITQVQAAESPLLRMLAGV